MMTIQEAIKSGKPFRRKDWKVWLKIENLFCFLIVNEDLIPQFLTKHDILATDWEIKSEKENE